ncbi:MAG: DUF3305 domain-containing protein [Bradyrhizobium sp.]|uniref:DUF3305 domain-containing protein n=1 Tax=Bradyrhizobium sp. TaxID=376 RepID=UPI0035367BE3
MSPAPLSQILVGVVVERRKADSPWIDYLWRPVGILPDAPDMPIWSVLREEGEAVLFYAGSRTIELHRSETARYRDNLATGSPQLWVVLSPAESDWPYTLAAVTADPAEGEAFTEAGANLVETIAMPDAVREAVEGFVAEHHVEREFVKRKRDRANPEALARRQPEGGQE